MVKSKSQKKKNRPFFVNSWGLYWYTRYNNIFSSFYKYDHLSPNCPLLTIFTPHIDQDFATSTASPQYTVHQLLWPAHGCVIVIPWPQPKTTPLSRRSDLFAAIASPIIWSMMTRLPMMGTNYSSLVPPHAVSAPNTPFHVAFFTNKSQIKFWSIPINLHRQPTRPSTRSVSLPQFTPHTIQTP